MAKTSKTKNMRRGSTKRVKRGGMYGIVKHRRENAIFERGSNEKTVLFSEE